MAPGVVTVAVFFPARVSQNRMLFSDPAMDASLSGWVGCHDTLVTPSLCPRSSASFLIPQWSSTRVMRTVWSTDPLASRLPSTFHPNVKILRRCDRTTLYFQSFHVLLSPAPPLPMPPAAPLRAPLLAGALLPPLPH